MFHRIRKNSKRSRRGALTVDFAITAPIFFLFIFAGIEFARVHMIQNAMENAAFEGARRGIVPGATAADCTEKARSLINGAGLNDVTVSIDPPAITASSDSVTVEVHVPITASNGFGLTGFMSGKTMKKSVTMPIEWSN